MNLWDAFYERFAMLLDEYEFHQRLCQNVQFFQMEFYQMLKDQLILDLYDETEQKIRKFYVRYL